MLQIAFLQTFPPHQYIFTAHDVRRNAQVKLYIQLYYKYSIYSMRIQLPVARMQAQFGRSSPHHI